MKIFAVDTSGQVAAAAVMENGKLLGEYFLNHKKTHSQKLMPMIDKLMRDLELCPQDIDIFSASSGPGSFTGLRIGITTVKAIAYAAGKPVVSVPTLDALAYNICMERSLVCPIMDARNNQVYTALYKRENRVMANITKYMGIPVNKLVELIKKEKQNIVFVGDAVDIHGEYLEKELGGMCEFAPGNMLLQRASSVAYAAYLKALNGEVENSFEMVPFYLRKSQAEREYDKKQLEAKRKQQVLDS